MQRAALAALAAEVAAIDDPHRAIDWLSTFPQVVLDRPRRAAVRFQDAAPDARAVVYAGIQAEPLVARAAGLLADATLDQRILARAVMNGMSGDGADLAVDVPEPVRPRGPARRTGQGAE